MYTYGMYTPMVNFLGDFFENFFGDFFGNFLTYNLLTIASFRIGVPSILLLLEKLEIEKTKTT